MHTAQHDVWAEQNILRAAQVNEPRRVASHCIASLETKDKRAHAARASSIERMPPLRCVALRCVALRVDCCVCELRRKRESRESQLDALVLCMLFHTVCIVYALGTLILCAYLSRQLLHESRFECASRGRCRCRCVMQCMILARRD